MKRYLVGLWILALALAVAGQQTPPVAPPQRPPEQAPAGEAPASNLMVRAAAPSYSDLYCSGFVTNQSIPSSNHVVGGWNSPHATRFSDRDYVYLSAQGLQEGSSYTILRELRDPSRFYVFRGQRREIASVGSPYAEMGRVKIIGQGHKVTVAQVEFTCDSIVPGDVAVPFVERAPVAYRATVPFNRFAPPNGKTTGRIVLAKDFDYVVGTGQKVYLNVGGDSGIKPGDYFRVVRSPTAVNHDPVDYLSQKAPMGQDTQKHPASMGAYGVGVVKIDANDYPRKSLGELIVLNVTPKSATAMLTLALEQIQVGDGVELEEPPPAPAVTAPAAATRPPMPPQISCAAHPGTVQAGQTSTIACQAASPDNRPVTVAFATSRGRITATGSNALLETRNLSPGGVTVTASATDDRNLSANTAATVNVEAPPAPPAPSKLAELQFKPNGAYVDNRAKALLDEIALRMQRETDARAMVVGFGDIATPAGQRLATARANNVKTYLTRDKGVDPQRISTRTEAGEDKAEVWLIPAGAQAPQQ